MFTQNVFRYFCQAYFVWLSFFELVHSVFILVPSHLSHFIILSTNFRNCTGMYTKLPPKIPYHHTVHGGRLVASWGHSKPFKQKMRKFTPSGTPFIITRALRYRSDCQSCAKSYWKLTSLIRIALRILVGQLSGHFGPRLLHRPHSKCIRVVCS